MLKTIEEMTFFQLRNQPAERRVNAGGDRARGVSDATVDRLNRLLRFYNTRLWRFYNKQPTPVAVLQLQSTFDPAAWAIERVCLAGFDARA